MKLKITEKELMSRTIYYAITAKTEDGDEVRGTLIAIWDDNNAIPSYDFTFLKDDSDIKLTNKQIDKLEDLAIDFSTMETE